MDTTTQPVENSVPPYQPQTNSEHKKIGPVVAILVIVLVLVAAAIYMFATRVNKQDAVNSDTAAAQEVQEVTNNSDEVNDLEADLSASVTGLDEQNF
jgi:uncharacterized protein YpmB